MKDYCAICGVYNHEKATYLTYLGLFSLQHRGQESSGIAVYKEGNLVVYKNLGLVTQVFSKEVLNALSSNITIGEESCVIEGTDSENFPKLFDLMNPYSTFKPKILYIA